MSEILFRQEVVRLQGTSLFGEPLFYQPLQLRAIVVALVLIALVFGVYASAVPLKQTALVRGHLDPEQGAMKVYSPAVGTLLEVLVEEGQAVQRGQVLATVLRGSFDATGQDSLEYGLTQLDAQIAQLNEKKQLMHGLSSLNTEHLAMQIRAGKKELDGVQAELDILKRRHLLGKRELQRQSRLLALGQVSAAQRDRALDSVYATEQAVQSLETSLTSHENALLRLRQQREQEPLTLAAQVLEIETNLVQLLSKRKEMEVGQIFSLTAPSAGIVSNLLSLRGASIDPRVPFLTILPSQTSLQALLYVPSRALGELQREQEVLLAFDAYPSRIYGYFPARIEHIANAVVDPREHIFPLDVQEPVYLVRAIPEPVTSVVRQGLNLRSGMQFSAYVVTGQQSLLQRLLSPLRGLRSRM